jgi:hypothetical protein
MCAGISLSQKPPQETIVSNWERKEADTLAESIGKHIKANPDLVKENQLLSIVKVSVDAASRTADTSTDEIRRFRADVCAICRSSDLYKCDVAEGWSSRCAFIFANASQFADL